MLERTDEETLPEKLLKEEMEREGLKFVSQFPVRSGFIIDFAFPDKRIGVEVDGVHWHSSKKQRRRDKFREYILDRGGWKIIRFWENEIYEDAKKCVEKIKKFSKEV